MASGWMETIRRWYAKRIVNVNINILIAGALAIAIMYSVMHQVHRLNVDEHLAGKLNTDVKFVNMGLSFVIDLIADLAVYYVLHWWANHVPGKFGGKLINPEYSDLTYLQDATKIQFERMVLSPILYAIAMGLQWSLLKAEFRPPVAASIGFGAGVITTRLLHTLWMATEQRRLRRKMLLAERAANRKAG